MDSQETAISLRRNVFDWDDLQIFHAVATTGSMSGAAAALGCQQPTVSKRMRQLESRLGAQLIDRRADGIVLTQAGEAALDYVRTMQRSAQQLESRISGTDTANTGDVTLHASDGLSTYWLARHMPRFMRVNPGINLHLLRPGAGAGPAPDLSITFTRDKDMDAPTSALGTMHYMPFASREFINSYGVPKSTHDLLNLRFLKLEQYDRGLSLWENRNEIVDAYINYAFRTDVSSILLETIRHGGGIAMAPTYLAALYPDELVVLDYDVRQDVRFWLKYLPGSQRVGRTKCVGDWINEIFDPTNNPWFREEFCHPGEFCEIEVVKPKL
ncbi:LysR family transcriptional regulator [Maricaulis sp.]|uniref:LysR family transcriptional regulator n=1 Tax=Maricaulis sp. TaxID=1486257 RepID=UPI003A8D951E